MLPLQTNMITRDHPFALDISEIQSFSLHGLEHHSNAKL